MNGENSIFGHLVELRNRLLKAIFSVGIIFLSLVYFSNEIYEFISSPLVEKLPEGASMIATNVAAPFFTPLKLTLVVSVFFSVPIILFLLWGFVAPGLYEKEKKLIFPLLFSSTILFYCGAAFAYFVVLPLVFTFLTAISLNGVQFATDITSYLDFVLALLTGFGVAFEVPVAIILLCWTGVVSAEKLASKRAHILVGIFVIAMLLTPPDVISQTLLAIPMYLLFELGLYFSRFYTKGENYESHNQFNVILTLKRLSSERTLWGILLFSVAVLELGAYVFNNVLELDSCMLCLYERIALQGIFISALLGVIAPHVVLLRCISLLSWFSFSVTGLVISIKHSQLLTHTASCASINIKIFPNWVLNLLDSQLDITNVCGKIDLTFLSLPVPHWFFLIFMLNVLSSFVLILVQLRIKDTE